MVNFRSIGKFLVRLIVAVVLVPIHLFVINWVQMKFLCDYPKPDQMKNYLNTLILTDPHLLGPRKGHWLDRLVRETEMAASFRVATRIFQPDLIIFLGDTLDEGLTVSQEEWKNYLNHMRWVFPMDETQERIFIPGNHDIGFHDHVKKYEPFLRRRFENAFNSSLVDLKTIDGIKFITVNSMALEGDGCPICLEAERGLKRVADILGPPSPTNRPVLLQHFPLYRPNDKNCNEVDSATGNDRERTYTPGYWCVSKEASRRMLELFRPRLAFSGHIHCGCITKHFDTEEWTVASFNWRNRMDPNFLLLQISPDSYHISKCFLPQEIVIFSTHVVLFCFVLFIYPLFFREKQSSVSKKNK